MFDFNQQIPKDGFEWAEVKGAATAERQSGETHVYLITRTFRPMVERNYDPFDVTGLFRILAETEPSKERILSFANEFGLLGRPISEPIMRPDGEPNRYDIDNGEKFDCWKKEIEDLRHCIELWTACEVSDLETLSRFIEWIGPEPRLKHTSTQIWYRSPLQRSRETLDSFMIASDVHNPPVFSSFQEGDLVEPGLFALQRFINRKLQEHRTIPQIYRRSLRRPVKLAMRYAPSSLISAIWLQFGNAVIGNKQYRQCDQCQRWFEVKPEKREDARFCGNSCRFRAYRLRKKKARILSDQGLSAEAIAERLGSDPETVRGWISK